MATLNADCWRVVFDFLEPETRALYHCLFVSKEFFTFSTRVLYRRPLKVPELEHAFSPFSTHRLGSLLDLCSGFTTAREGQQQQQQTSSSPSPTLSSTTVPLIHPLHDYSPPLDMIPATGLPLASPTTINYYNLVIEYPGSIDIQDNISKWIPFLTCYAETIPKLELSVQEFDILLPLVTKFRALHSLTICLPPLSAISTLIEAEGEASLSSYFDNMTRFIQSHRSFFPGQLKVLGTGFWLNCWDEFIQMQAAMGGTTQQCIIMSPIFKNDLDGLIVSRLKILRVTFQLDRFGRVPEGLDIKVVNLLKRCLWLETLELGWPADVDWDWTSLLLLQHSGETMFGQDKKSCMRLKHLVIEGNTIMAVQAMHVFKDNLETVRISKYIDGTRDFSSRQVLDPVDWKGLFVLPKLKDMTLDMVSFIFENLCCCPALESISLDGERWDRRVIENRNHWPVTAIGMLSITLRCLSLSDYGIDGLDFLSLQHFVNLATLCITYTKTSVEPINNNTNSSSNHSWPLIDLSEKDCYFPKLRHIVLHGKLGVQIQGQILWLAPKLEHYFLDLRSVDGTEGDLRMDTFLYPPSELKATPVYTSKANFSTLKHFSLTSSAFASLESSKHLADALFSQQSDPILMGSGNGSVGDSDGEGTKGKVVESNKIDGGDSEDQRAISSTNDENNNTDKRFLFPNLQLLDLFMYIHEDCIEQLLVRPMRNLPRLHHLWCRGLADQDRYSGQLKKWFQEVPQDSRGDQHANYRYRPSVPVAASSSPYTITSSSTTSSGVVSASGGDAQKVTTSRCVLEFGPSFKSNNRIRHQLKVPNSNIAD